MTADRFIPFRKQDIVNMCLQEIEIQDLKVSFTQFCEILSSLIHYDYHNLLDNLKSNYAPFDPNSDTRLIKTFTPNERAKCQTAFAKDFAKVLDAANFEMLTEQDLKDALSEVTFPRD
ncbi:MULTISPECIES: hypothetical protein [unclassified Pseudoalteromonas]|uniref:hypothetical protein n=1 Tax=unclassified Pseudoalteromonas TaxID=194690 RepID=UPI0005A879D5|nr:MULTISPECIES: hypothetical protein [unclassified Pseudoalteromonas]